MSYINAERVDGKLSVWERDDPSTRILKRFDYPLEFYIEDPKGTHTSVFGDKCTKLTFDSVEEFNYSKQQLQKSGLKTFESDLAFEYKVLSTHYYEVPAPTLNVTFLDIEVDYNKEFGFAGTKNPYAPINAIAMYHSWSKRTVVYAVPPKSWGTDPKQWNEMVDKTLFDLSEIYFCSNEKDLLLRILVEIEDSDALVGWNSHFFDIPYIGLRIEKVLGKSYLRKMSFPEAPMPRYREVELYGNIQTTLDLGGRLSIDYIDIFKKFEASMRPSYKLEAISNEILPELPKLTYEGSLADQYNNNFNFFLRYNIRDTECLKGFEEKLGYVALANTMFHSSTGLYKNILGTVKLAEYAIVNRCHRVLNQVVPDSPEVDETPYIAHGAYVLTPKSGLRRWAGSIDIKSLYPSAIRSINISPETIVGQFTGNVADFESIYKNENKPITLRFETGDFETKPAVEWKTHLRNNQWSISGFGTVFDQKTVGIIPSILAEWYDLRKKYQKLYKDNKEAGNYDQAAYYNRLQYCYKIKLNSLYGALLNKHFKFHDRRLGESTTGTGRAILKFQCARTNELLTGEFDPEGEAILYGDTDSTYFSTFKDDKESAITIADSVADEVNKSYPIFMREAFLCTPSFDNKVSCEREVVAASGIFVTPKRYVLHVVNKDGFDTDELKTMGLDIKKTILPKAVQDKLSNFIERFLKGESWDSLSHDIVAYKEGLMNIEDVSMLGLPKGIKGVEKYTEDYKLYGVGARLPGHVAAAIYYNQKIREFNDKDSFPIVSDMKIRVFYLKNPDGKFKSIALPTDLERIPQWFKDNIVIDKQAQIQRLVDNPLENILKAVGKEPPTAKTIFISQLFEFD